VDNAHTLRETVTRSQPTLIVGTARAIALLLLSAPDRAALGGAALRAVIVLNGALGPHAREASTRLGLPASHTFGWPETCGLATAQRIGESDDDDAGAALPGLTINVEVDAESTVVVRGAMVCSSVGALGYVATAADSDVGVRTAAAAMRDDGTLVTHTAGRLDDARLVPMTWGRRSDEIEVDAGEVALPVDAARIESAATQCEVIERCILVAGAQPLLAALVAFE
jgi:long-subunit acyl-CoA synthetase (AMP-forming)